MPVVGAAAARELEPLLGGDCPLPGAQWLDVHTHTGQNDPDGIRGTDAELLAALDDAGVGRALVFSSHEPNGYPAANDRVREEAARAGGRLEWLGRVDPNAAGALEEARRCLELGARGIKLHPRSDSFGLPHPVVDTVAAEVAARGLVLLFHSGRGIPNLGEDCALLAERHPQLRVVLAHAGISDLGLLAPAAARLPNLLFDMAWWQVADLLALVTTIPPGQILFASDAPYGHPTFGAINTLRYALQVGMSPDQVAAVMGAQADRVIEGEEPLDAGPAVGTGSLRRDIVLDRVETFLMSAMGQMFQGVEPSETLQLAALACEVGDGAPQAEVCTGVLGLLELRETMAEGEPPQGPRGFPAGMPLILAAAVVCATPDIAPPVLSHSAGVGDRAGP
jgi:predicted TIM-barrel fold metal-dependent hydrolase